eukprot:5511989-Amphidinium_carterae.1
MICGGLAPHEFVIVVPDHCQLLSIWSVTSQKLSHFRLACYIKKKTFDLHVWTLAVVEHAARVASDFSSRNLFNFT